MGEKPRLCSLFASVSNRRRRQPQLLAQGLAFINFADMHSALQLWNRTIKDLSRTGRKDQEHDIDVIRSALRGSEGARDMLMVKGEP